MLIDFWAKWCAPCLRLKKTTFADPRVTKAIQAFEVVYVDTDAHPDLARAFGVSTIPDILLVDANGLVVDRIRSFVDADEFLRRLAGSHREER